MGRPGVPLVMASTADAMSEALFAEQPCRSIDESARDFQLPVSRLDRWKTSWHPDKLYMTIDIKKIK